MEKIFKKLCEMLEIEQSELYSKLNITNEPTYKDIANLFGVYSVFETKEELQNYIQNKLSNKNKEITVLEQQIEEAKQTSESTSLNLEKFKNIARNQFINTWNQNKLPEWDFEKLNLEEVNFDDLNSSVFKIAEANNLKPKQIPPKEVNDIETFKPPVESVQIFGVGARRKD
ncbi:hypothetical protein [[Mycoplasma] gypis]|uniref:hypothetical protein n=1 Tax=[Mycoplasma] gypis TaxID=92404 RepID=UPI001967C0BA|nr:hypothetical protein [[Mycoplasma] gypis]MBN0919681.1 hypothetical protein [[Mycoplasma] gypis]